MKPTSETTIAYALGIYINPGMRNLLLEYLKRASLKYKSIHVMFCYWWPGVEPEPFVGMVNSLGIKNLTAWEFSIMASPAFGRKLGWAGANWYKSLTSTFDEIGVMKKFLRKVDADVIHMILTEYQSSFAFARAAHLAKTPVKLLSFTGVSPTPAKFRERINRITDRYLDGVLLATAADKSGADKYFPRSKKSIVHGWGLAPDLFRLKNVNPKKIRDEIGVDQTIPLIGTTTRIAPNKGQETLIRSLPEVVKVFPNLKCVILGGRYDDDQGEKTRLMEIVSQLRLEKNVLFLGERNDTPDIFAAYDAAVHLADFDYLPFGVLECMALGKVCVCTDVGGIPSIINDSETGFLIKPGDIEAAAVKIIKTLQMGKERDEIGARAQKLVFERYDLDRLVERVAGVYMDALEDSLRDEYR